MPEKKEYSSESDIWNVAKGYVNLKVLAPLVEIDQLIKVAQFGNESMADSLLIPDEVKVMNRIEAMKRIIDNLKQLYENTKFVIKKADLELMKTLYERTCLVEDVLGAISHDVIDQRNHSTRKMINEKHFIACLNELRDIKMEISSPINRASLIFPADAGLSLEELQRELEEGG